MMNLTKKELETEIAYLRNLKVYVQDDKELYQQVQDQIDEYAEVFDEKYGLENYMVD